MRGRNLRRVLGQALALAAPVALAACSSVSPYAGMGVGTNVGGVHLGTGLSVNPLSLLRSAGSAATPAAPAVAPPQPRQLTPVRDFVGPGGRLCRDFVETVATPTGPATRSGTACQQPDGSWLIPPG
ncbi:hypothetical protein [Arenibaculum pallidiluteum]|uniref:hypothetical protein n=1 Tax=Arenibaculum pallidiluteum TaxID=2812559 RepID=UPI001A964D0B|nr:hypothetical protein [Arenibaculum pallidiluteum]